ncbi:hypothetical protein [Leifsonia poae]|uniref:hypothetical protein n=1 Tax=Leifsonia poae TaxID=110933 RepID=UPI001CC03174|nr:hypothetical protein [Leifsonia poae]
MSEESDDLRRLRTERDELLATVRDLAHLQLIGRDIELGLRAELMQAKIDAEIARAATAGEAARVMSSSSWRVGRAVTWPVRVLRRTP